VIEGLRPYPDYKETELPWVDRMPSHWSQRRMKFLFHERVQKGFPNEPLLAATQTKGVVRKEDYGERTVTAQKDFHLLKLVEVGDFVISLRSFQGGIEIAHNRGIISPAYTILAPKEVVDRSFFANFFKSQNFINALTLFVTGIREGQNIDYVRLSRAYMPLPPKEEQEKIGRFLFTVNQKINRAIQTKKRLLTLLNEQKQTIIHRAVTRGLDPSVPLKPSNIPWLGDIPKHWQVKPLKHWARINEKTLGIGTDPEYEFRYFDIGCVGTGRLVHEPEQMKFKNAPSRARRMLRFGDTIISTVRTYLKAVYFISFHDENLIASTGFAVLSPREGVMPEFLTLGIQSPAFIDRVTANSIGIAYPAIAESRLSSFHLAFPADKKEQEKIVEYVHEKVKPFDKAIKSVDREVGLLREYKTRLVADVVTGKLDVRPAAEKLPLVEEEIQEESEDFLEETADAE